MVYISRDVDYYQFNYGSRTTNGVTRPHALIICFDLNGEVGRIEFWESLPIPPNAFVNNTIYLKFHISRFNDIVTILRYEKKLLLGFEDKQLDGMIYTKNLEPAGEQEGV
jgi:hypothetical protein